MNEAKESLINGKLFKTFGFVIIAEIEHWNIIKGKSQWANAVFTDSGNPVAASHFVFAFTTTNIPDILYFEFIL